MAVSLLWAGQYRSVPACRSRSAWQVKKLIQKYPLSCYTCLVEAELRLSPLRIVFLGVNQNVAGVYAVQALVPQAINPCHPKFRSFPPTPR